jgi:hypothetical protein
VVADTHGEFEILVELLQKHGVINRALQWSFGSGHLAVLGDVFDRGPNHTESSGCSTSSSARRGEGGGLHFVLGNHETLALLGARQYLNPNIARAPRRSAYRPTRCSGMNTTLLGDGCAPSPACRKSAAIYVCMVACRRDRESRLHAGRMNQSVRDMLTTRLPTLARTIATRRMICVCWQTIPRPHRRIATPPYSS